MSFWSDPLRWRVLAGIFLGLVLVELGALLVGPSLPETLTFHTETADAKARLLNEQRGEIHVLTGTSQVLVGIDAQEFPGQTLNMALSGGVPELQNAWLLDVVVEQADVSRVVWGVNPLIDLNAEAPTPTVVRRYELSQAPEPWFEKHLASMSAAVRYRDRFSAGGAFGFLHEEARPIDELGNWPTFEPAPLAPQGRRWAAALAGYQFGNERWLVDAVQKLRERSVEVILVEMPLPTRTTTLLPHSYEEEQAKLVALSESLDIQLLLSPRSLWRDRSFEDYTHFTPEARATFSTWLAAELAAIP